MEDNNSLPKDNGSLSLKEDADVSKLSHDEMIKVESIKSQINISDSQAIITYGVGAQREISNFSENVLNEVRTKDSGYVGNILSDLVFRIKDLKVDGLGKGNFLSKIPVLGNLWDSARKFIARYETLSVHIEKIIDELDKARMQMLRDITLLDAMYDKNLEYLKNLDLYIVAGQLKLKELESGLLLDLKTRADASKKPEDVQKYNDFNQFLNRFDKKLYDLKLSRMIVIQTAPQIRLIQNGDQALVEKVQSSILNTIPLWKNQIVIAITLFRQKKSLELQKEVTKTTNELLEKNSELLKDSTIEIAKESERGIVEIETLKKVNDNLITTIEETLRIQSEGKTKRKQAETELTRIESDLKSKLMSLTA
jgi:uncharacterized protein YaaN involved in tellurite resistance